MSKYFLFSFLFSLFSSFSFSQLPDTDIWLLDISDSAGQIKLSNPQNITKRKGYDNQPAFSPDGKYILFTSVRDSSQQADIYKYDLKTKQTTQFTKTATSEYSPTFMPDGKNISVVMVEKDSAQRLWKFPIKGGAPSCIMENVDSVGYHCWYNKNTLGIFILTNPFTLQIVNTKSQRPFIVADSIGRCIKMTSYNSIMCFTVKTKEDKNQFAQFILPGYGTSKLNLIIEGEDYTIYDYYKMNIVYSFGTKLFLANIGENNSKKEINDFSFLGIKNIARIAISADGKKMAIVCTTN